MYRLILSAIGCLWCSIGALALVGHLLTRPTLYKWGAHGAGMGLPTAIMALTGGIGFFIMAFGLIWRR